MIAISALIALVPVGICYLARWLLDRGRTEPPRIFPLLSLLGGSVVSFLQWSSGPVSRTKFNRLRALTRSSRCGVFCSSALEETGKAIVLVPLLWTKRLRSPVDGLMYGFAAGFVSRWWKISSILLLPSGRRTWSVAWYCASPTRSLCDHPWG